MIGHWPTSAVTLPTYYLVFFNVNSCAVYTQFNKVLCAPPYKGQGLHEAEMFDMQFEDSKNWRGGGGGESQLRSRLCRGRGRGRHSRCHHERADSWHNRNCHGGVLAN